MCETNGFADGFVRMYLVFPDNAGGTFLDIGKSRNHTDPRRGPCDILLTRGGGKRAAFDDRD